MLKTMEKLKKNKIMKKAFFSAIWSEEDWFMEGETAF